MRQLLAYCAVGGIGFVVEAVLIAGLQYGGGWSAFGCRFVSFPTAVLVTWWLNHRLTFGSRGGWHELVRYLGTQGIGLTTNLLAYALAIWAVPALNQHAVVALVFGSALGLAVNYVLARRFVFAARE
jgi:putative flippase GtrA